MCLSVTYQNDEQFTTASELRLANLLFPDIDAVDGRPVYLSGDLMAMAHMVPQQ